jgi:hypothetical protein
MLMEKINRNFTNQGTMKKKQYAIVQTKKDICELGQFEHYGIEVNDTWNTETCFVDNIFQTKQDILQLLSVVVKNEVSVVHLYDTVYDHLCEKYSIFS